MNIPLVVQEIAGGLKPVAYFTITGTRLYGRLKAFVDTGSPNTVIGEGDAIKLNIPITKLPREKTSYGLGGGSVDLHSLSKVMLYFRDEDDNSIMIEFPSIYISRCAKVDERTKTIAQSIPSILGVDFLVKHKFKLIFDPSNKVAYLEKLSTESSEG